MNGGVDLDRLFCCYSCRTVPAAFKKRVMLMSENLTPAERGSLCCAPLGSPPHDGAFFSWGLPSQRRELAVPLPPSAGSCLLLPACRRLRLVTAAGWAHPLSRCSYSVHGGRESCVLLKTVFDLCSWRQFLCSKTFYWEEGFNTDKILPLSDEGWEQ